MAYWKKTSLVAGSFSASVTRVGGAVVGRSGKKNGDCDDRVRRSGLARGFSGGLVELRQEVAYVDDGFAMFCGGTVNGKDNDGNDVDVEFSEVGREGRAPDNCFEGEVEVEGAMSATATFLFADMFET